MSKEIISQKMRDAIGVKSQPVSYPVERWHVKRFAEAIGDDNPLYYDSGFAKQHGHRLRIVVRGQRGVQGGAQTDEPAMQSVGVDHEWPYEIVSVFQLSCLGHERHQASMPF